MTNDVESIQDANGSTLYTAFLNNKGRVVSDAFVRNADDAYYLDCHMDQATKLFKQLRMYRLKSAVTVDDLSNTHEVVWSHPASSSNDEGGALYVDPRLSDLGKRGIVEKESSDSNCAKKCGDVEYTALRTKLGVAEGSEIVSSIPLEFNLDWLNGINFRKGCYVGQELIARTHFRGIVRKRCVPCVLSVENDDDEDGHTVIDPGPVVVRRGNEEERQGKEKSVGKVLSSVTVPSPDGFERHGLAMIRLAYLKEANDLFIDSSGDDAVRVIPIVPTWWSLDDMDEQKE